MKQKGKFSCVVLAAGQGTRMKSDTPKVLHHLYDKPMLLYCLDTLAMLKPEKMVVIVAKRHKEVKDAVGNRFNVTFAVQKEQKGTAHALLQASSFVKNTILVTNGDTPLITMATLKKFLSLHRRNKNAVSMLSFKANDPSSYGRIIRDKHGIPVRVVEEKDASPKDKAIQEVNSGVYAIEQSAIPFLRDIRLNKKKGEYYLTDIIHVAREKDASVGVYQIGDEEEFLGINTRQDLSMAHEALRKKTVRELQEKGVLILDAGSAYIWPSVRIGRDTEIYPNVHLQGNTVIGNRCTIYPNVRIIDSRIKEGAVIKDSTLIENSNVGAGAQVGPFSHIRPESNIGESAKIGNFVEVKKSSIGRGTKAMHLSYLGDATIGKDANIGAGTITCNYDGKKKFRTVIEDGVFVGSDTQLVAPVRVGKGSYIGAGSTITKDVPAGDLAVSRADQKNLKGGAKKKHASASKKRSSKKS